MEFSNKNHKEYGTLLTASSTFILGYLNVYSATFNQENLISAQTGNLINLAMKLSKGEFYHIGYNLLLIFGFALGCLFSSVFILKQQNNHHALLKRWLIFSSVIWLQTVFAQQIDVKLSLVMLSGLAGIALSFFREFFQVDLNNGIMTGNLKNMYQSFIEIFFKRGIKKGEKVIKYFLVFLLFFGGCIIGGIMTQKNQQVSLNLLSLLCLFLILNHIKDYYLLASEKKNTDKTIY